MGDRRVLAELVLGYYHHGRVASCTKENGQEEPGVFLFSHHFLLLFSSFPSYYSCYPVVISKQFLDPTSSCESGYAAAFVVVCLFFQRSQQISSRFTTWDQLPNPTETRVQSSSPISGEDTVSAKVDELDDGELNDSVQDHQGSVHLSAKSGFGTPMPCQEIHHTTEHRQGRRGTARRQT